MSDGASLTLRTGAPDSTWDKRLARAWSAGALPVVLLPAIAIALGPQGLAVIGSGVATLLDPAVPVALATIGTLVALQLPAPAVTVSRLGVASAVEALVTTAVVAAGLYSLAPLVGGLGSAAVWLVAVACGLCAASSSPLAVADPRPSAPPETIVREIDFLLPVIAGGVLLAWMQQPSADAALAFGRLLAVSGIVAVAGALLASGTTSPAEQRVFGMAVLLLLGGVADTLGLSALLSGLCAGAVWRRTGTAVREALTPVIAYVQHPLLIIMLLVAGMRVQITVPLLALTAAYVLLRMAAKLVAGALAARVLGRPTSAVAARLASPGVFGVALALTFARGDAGLAGTFITVVVLGTAASQLLHALAVPGTEDR